MQGTRVVSLVVCVGLASLTGACSSGSALTTGTLLGGGAKQAAAPPPPETPTDRALHVATTAARAQRCGYVFDPGAVRQSYLAFESQQAGSPELAAKAQQSYDFAHAKVSKAIGAEADYCSEDKTTAIKRDLTQVLAGNYSSNTRAAQPNVGWWSANKSAAPMDREKIFDPRL